MIENAVIGAGPVGCLAALALARRGEQVTILEAESRLGYRFAGEWLHPDGVAALERAGILEDPEFLSGTTPQRGFAVFAHPGDDAVILDYPDSRTGFSCRHSSLIRALRKRVEKEPLEILLGAKVSHVGAGRIEFQQDRGAKQELRATRIIGADGKGSLVRGALRLPRSSQVISRMVGTVLRDLELPHEGFGHVILGPPGPVLLYRISPDSIRVLIDVPADLEIPERNRWGRLIGSEYAPFLPDGIAQALLQVDPGSFEFRANRCRPRIDYGRKSLCLVGDAVGFQHPLTAMGMTLGFQDAEALAEHQSFSEFQRVRRMRTFVPELLAHSLYEVFSRKDPGTHEIRRAICCMWRRFPHERERTMRLLAGEVTSPMSFSCSLLRVMQLAVVGSLDSEPLQTEFNQVFRTLGSIGQILQGIARYSSSRIAGLSPASAEPVASS